MAGKARIEFENDGKDIAAGSVNRLIERLTHETTFGILGTWCIEVLTGRLQTRTL